MIWYSFLGIRTQSIIPWPGLIRVKVNEGYPILRHLLHILQDLVGLSAP